MSDIETVPLIFKIFRYVLLEIKEALFQRKFASQSD